MPSNGTAELQVTPEMLAMFAQQSQGTNVIRDDDIKFHDDPAEKAMVLPRGMTYEKAGGILRRKHEESQKRHRFRRVFRYRPDDGAHAAAVVLKRMFGITVGKEMKLPFGMTRPPEYRTIEIGHNKTIEVPWGMIEVPSLGGAEVYLDADDGEYGPVFEVAVDAPKMHKETVEALFTAIQDELAGNSIYRGKALMGARSLRFMDVGQFDASQIVFSDDVTATLDGGLFAVLRYGESLRSAKLSMKRAVLLYGPFGTGKSSIGLITAQVATRHGWTFLSARAGKDKLREVLQTAKLYEPAVVFVEDIDTHTPGANDKVAISELLDVFDGIAGKNDQLLVVMTTNHIENVPAGMLRPGRLDYAIPIDGLDRPGVERLIKAVVPPGLLSDDIDYDAVYSEMTDFQPAWVKATADRAKSFAIDRENGALTFTLTTYDLVQAARSLHAQLRLMAGAEEGTPVVAFEAAFSELVRNSADGMELRETGNSVPFGRLAAPAALNSSK
jgi:transitional endoplasmic reticulum ATPase